MDNDKEDPARAYGVTFGPLKPALREHQYPVSVSELIEQYGGSNWRPRRANSGWSRCFRSARRRRSPSRGRSERQF